jgi:hypothetical protein
MQSRFTDQTAKLDSARALERVLQQAQAVLEKRLVDQTVELRHARAEVQAKKETKT